MSEKTFLVRLEAEEKRLAQHRTLTILDQLRKTRAARGGVGAPLIVPTHLAGGPLVITDADLAATQQRQLTSDEEVEVQHFGETDDET